MKKVEGDRERMKKWRRKERMGRGRGRDRETKRESLEYGALMSIL